MDISYTFIFMHFSEVAVDKSQLLTVIQCFANESKTAARESK